MDVYQSIDYASCNVQPHWTDEPRLGKRDRHRMVDEALSDGWIEGPVVDFRVRAVANSVTNEDGRVLHSDGLEKYSEIYGDRISDEALFPALVSQMEDIGVRGVVQAEYESGPPRDANLAAARMIQARPDLFVAGIATVDPRDADALSQLQAAHEELGLRGWNFQPGFLKVRPTDRICYPLFEYCQANDHPVTVHTGINFSRTGPIEFGRPIYIDQVACDFPDLVLVCNHGGWPWVMETAAVLWKHENVYADFGGVAPKYMAGSKGGWEPIAHWMNSQIADKVLLGTDWPMLRYDRLRAELHLLGLDGAATSAYLRDNAVRLLDRLWGPVVANKAIEPIVAIAQ